MSELPSSWDEVRFGKLNRFSSRTLDPASSPDELFELYSVPSFPSDMPESLLGSDIGSTKQLVEPADVLVCKINPRINRVWQVRPKQMSRQIASSEWIVMRAPEVDPRFLRYFFISPEFRELMCQDVTGVGGSLTRAQPKRVATFRIPIAPLNEQKRIADKLDAVLARVDACRELLDRIPDIFKRFRQSVLSTATSGKLTEKWREERGVTEWQATTVQDIAVEVFDGPFGSHLKSKDYSEDGVRVVRLENIGWLNFIADKKTFISKEKYQGLRKHTLKAGDVLFSSFIAEDVRVCLLPTELSDKAINKADCFCVRTDATVCDPAFLVMRLACRSTLIALEEQVHGATRPRINLRQLKEFAFDLPSVAEQEEIVRRVESLFAYADRLEARYTAARNQIERLTFALLTKAFRGELVPQDPNDEPAAVLLERIRVLRAETTKLSMPRKAKQNNKEVRHLMQKLLDVLVAATDWLPAEEAFQRCGVSDGVQTDRIEELYAELRQLDKAGTVQVRRIGDFDELKLTPKE